jgi:hypothetical protein
MSKWSKWVAVTHWLDNGWNDPEVPWAEGVYRFRVRPGHSERGGEVVYIGRAGKNAGTDTSGICDRVASFITAGMGFWTRHRGGNRFYEKAGTGDDEASGHRLSVRDLEVSWAVDDDPVCREAEEMLSLPRRPVFNKQAPRTCRCDDCSRAVKLWDTYRRW